MWFVVYHYGFDSYSKSTKKWIVGIFTNYPNADEYVSQFGSEYSRRFGSKLYVETVEGSLSDVSKMYLY